MLANVCLSLTFWGSENLICPATNIILDGLGQLFILQLC